MEHHSNPLPGQVKHERGKAAINREGEASLGAPYGALNTARPLEVTLKYFKNIPAIRGIQQISRPGNRTYINVKRILKYSVEQN
jgi:ribosomal protein S8